MGEDGIVAIRLTPRASADRLGGTWVDADGHSWLSASVTAPPDQGRANGALIALLAKALDLPGSTLSLDAGTASRLKRIRIAGMTAATAQNIEGLT